jgi:hypothetical protein
MLVVRVVVITVLATLLCFCVALFFGIAGIMVIDTIGGGGINLASAYRHVALPIAATALVVAFCAALITETRRYRRARSAALL